MCDDKPIRPAFRDGVKTFEEYLNIRLNESSSEIPAFPNENVLQDEFGIENCSSESPRVKRQFLKKGDGISRFIARAGYVSPDTDDLPSSPRSPKRTKQCQDVRRKQATATSSSTSTTGFCSGTTSSTASSMSSGNVYGTFHGRKLTTVNNNVLCQPNKANSMSSSVVKQHVPSRKLYGLPIIRKRSPASPVIPVVKSSTTPVRVSLSRQHPPKQHTTSVPISTAQLSPKQKRNVINSPPGCLHVDQLSPEPVSQSQFQASAQSSASPVDTTICSEAEFEQMEDFIEEQNAADVSICSQASLVRRFMQRSSLKPVPSCPPLQNINSEQCQNSREKDIDDVVNGDCSSVVVAGDAHNNTLTGDDEGDLPIAAPSSSKFQQILEQQAANAIQQAATSLQKSKKKSATKQSSEAEDRFDNEIPAELNSLLRGKIEALDVEICRFKEENRRVDEMKRDYERLLRESAALRKKFNDEITEERLRLEQTKAFEMDRIRRERKTLDQLRSQVQTLTSEKNTAELAQLRERLRRVEAEGAEKESRLNALITRHKEQIKKLQAENDQMRAELVMFERLRIETTSGNSSNYSKVTSAASKLGGTSAKLANEHSNAAAKIDPGGGVNDNKASRKQVEVSVAKCLEGGGHEPVTQNSSNNNNNFALESVADHMALDTGSGPLNAAVMAKWLSELKLSLEEDAREVVHTRELPGDKTEITRTDGSRRIVFANKTIKITGPGGRPVFVLFFNHDMKRTIGDGVVAYYYADSGTIETTHPDGLEVQEFSNGQVEKHHPNGTLDIIFPDGTIKQTLPDGTEQTWWTDGTVQTRSRNGEEIVEFANGEKEIHTAETKTRIFPGGTVRTIYNTTGLMETRYADGKVRRRYLNNNHQNGAAAVVDPQTATAALDQDGAVTENATVT